MATEVVKTIRASGGDYSSLSAWHADYGGITTASGYSGNGDLVTNDVIAVAECYDDWPTGLNDSVTINNFTTDSTRYPIIRCAAGHESNGTPGSGFNIRDSGVAGTTLAALDPYTQIIGIDVVNNSGSGSAISISNYGLIEKCLAKSGSGDGIALSGTAGKNLIVRNNICYENVGSGIKTVLASTKYIYNNTCVNNAGYGIEVTVNSSTQHVKNNLCSGNANGDYSFAGTSIDDDYNASADATATGGGGANSLNSQTFSFVDAANDDYHLSAATAGGTDLSAATYGFTDDIDGDTRSNWDFGADEYVAGGGGTTVTKTASLGAILSKQGILRTASLDAILQQTLTLTASLDSVLSKTSTESANLDAVLQKTVALTASLDAILQSASGTQVRTTSLDAILKGTIAVVSQLDAILQKTSALTAQFDSVLMLRSTLTASFGAVLSAVGLTKTTSLDAVLQVESGVWTQLSEANTTWSTITKASTTWS